MNTFKTVTSLKPKGDQPKAIDSLSSSITAQESPVLLHGVTGTGKSATLAWSIEKIGKPTLVIEPNKVLASQMARELKTFFPDNEVCFFVSHFSYYRPEAYIPHTDVFIEKDSSIDSEIEKLRHFATTSLLTRSDVIVVASVSAIYGLGRPEEYRSKILNISQGLVVEFESFLKKLVDLGYSRKKLLAPSSFRVSGDTLDIMPSDKDSIIRIVFFGDTIEEVKISHDSGNSFSETSTIFIPPVSHHVFDNSLLKPVLSEIRDELDDRLEFFRKLDKIVEYTRLKNRVGEDLDNLENLGFCKGIENYSRFFDRRKEGQAPFTLLDYFPEDFLTVVDESHITLPQIRAMYEGDRSRKQNLVDYGFRLPSALDNRPLKNEEFWSKIGSTIFLSATPSDFEYKKSRKTVTMFNRPTGLLDPKIYIKPNIKRFDDILRRIRKEISVSSRSLISCITVKSSENIRDFLIENDIKASFLHHKVDTANRLKILQDLRSGKIDAIVGVNLLREGLDLPEVGFIAVLDADLQGFLRSHVSLVQTIGRAARNIDGKVVFYCDKITPAIEQAVVETRSRRALQIVYNDRNSIVPQKLSSSSKIDFITEDLQDPSYAEGTLLKEDILAEIEELSLEMRENSKNLNFEKATVCRDRILELRQILKELN